MPTISLKNEICKLCICLLLLIISGGKNFAQHKNECSCPMFKGKILVDDSYKTMGGKFIPRAEIKSKRNAVYSASSGMVTDIDTLKSNRIYIKVKYCNYTYMYENMITVDCVIGQNIESGKLIGKVEEEEHLYITISDGKSLINPETLLPCKVVRVDK